MSLLLLMTSGIVKKNWRYFMIRTILFSTMLLFAVVAQSQSLSEPLAKL